MFASENHLQIVRMRQLLYLSASGRRAGHISLWPLLQALHIHAIHHTSQPWLCLQLQKNTHVIFPLFFFQSLQSVSVSQSHLISLLISERVVLHVRAWVEHGAEDCEEVSEKLGRDLVCVHPEASHRLLHTWRPVAWIGSLYCWNSPRTDCKVTEETIRWQL